ncbi:MAG: hypothetical protein EOP94_02335 [Zymomonas sp.]|nr:MAG: hypothetical protein EOP94_02335 [Zymomonas sp.]
MPAIYETTIALHTITYQPLPEFCGGETALLCSAIEDKKLQVDWAAVTLYEHAVSQMIKLGEAATQRSKRYALYKVSMTVRRMKN